MTPEGVPEGVSEKEPIVKSVKTISIDVSSGENEFGLRPVWRGEQGEAVEGVSFIQAIEREVHRRKSDESDQVDRWHEKESFTRLRLSGADFREAHLRAADFTGADLCMADFFRADLTEAVLAGADLTYADLTMANLEGADLRFCDLCKASLKGAVLRGANLSEADLEHAVLTEADLRGANFARTDMRFVRLDGAIMDETTTLPIPLGEAIAMGAIVRSRHEGQRNRARRQGHGQH